MSTNNGDKRSVSTDALETLGNKIGPDEKRDAIHLAVVPTVAKAKLWAGQHVTADGYPAPQRGVGIVDPFLEEPVQPGERFWLVIYPRMITSLRHVWSHPAFPDEPERVPVTPGDPFVGLEGNDPSAALASLQSVEAVRSVEAVVTSENWLREFCRENDCPSYDTTMRLLRTLIEGKSPAGEEMEDDWVGITRNYSHITFIGLDAHCDVPQEFWKHFEVVTGLKLEHAAGVEGFSCSC